MSGIDPTLVSWCVAFLRRHGTIVGYALQELEHGDDEEASDRAARALREFETRRPYLPPMENNR